MDDDFNTGGAIGELFEVVHVVNRFAGQLAAGSGSAKTKGLGEYRAGMVVLKELSQILGLFRRPIAIGQTSSDALTAPLIELLIELRNRLRKEKNFGLADEIRKRLSELGVTLEDRADGTTRPRIEPRRQGSRGREGIAQDGQNRSGRD
jgi:cysteinyl-tRNA synthetase